MSNTTKDAPAPKPATPAAEPTKKEVPTALLLEEDDEFEEFPAEKWDSKDSSASTTNGAGAKKELLWEDSWDDDDVGDDFSVQLRGELLKGDQMQA